MSKKVFVGGLSWGTNDDSLQKAFGRFGDVEEAKVVTDRETGRSRGFGFVTFTESSSADQAVSEMNGTDLDGRTLKVDIAQDRPRRDGPGGGGGGGGRGGSGGGGGGGYSRDRW